MSPLIHLDDDVTTLEHREQGHDAEKRAERLAAAKRPEREVFSPIAKETDDAIDAAMEALTAAVASGDVDAIADAQAGLENARTDAMRAAQRNKDLVLAQSQANAQRIAAQRAERQRIADAIERRVRKQSPRIRIEAPRGRAVIVTLGGSGNEPMYSAECVRRLTHALSQAAAHQLAASRNMGRTVPMADFLTPLIGDETHGIALYLRNGIAKIVKSTK
jgi:hypothetical protein